MRSALLPVLLLSVATASWAQTSQPARPAVPVEPITALLDAFETHPIVALGDPHGNEQAHAFRLSLIRDPRFAATVNDIVVEWGNALCQDMMDRYVNGAKVSHQELSQAWQNTTQRRPGVPPSAQPLLEEFFWTVREVNASVPRERRLRVLLGDPPIDWDDIESEADKQQWIDLRDIHPAELIRREVLDKQRHALVIYGGMHLQRRNLFANYELMDDRRVHTLVQQLEGMKAELFTVWVNVRADLRKIQADVTSWPTPSLALVRGTTFGAADFEFYYPSEVPRARFLDGQIVPIPGEEWRTLPMDEQFDAVLYLGLPAP